MYSFRRENWIDIGGTLMEQLSDNFESLSDFNKLFSDLSKEKENIPENLKIIYQSSLYIHRLSTIFPPLCVRIFGKN